MTTLTEARGALARYGDAALLLTDPRLPRPKYGGLGDGGPVIYICDVETGRTLLLETASKALQILSEQADIDAVAYNEVRAAVALLIGDVLNSTRGIHPDTRRGVILGAAFCITETRGFHITKHHGADVQYLLVRYRDASNGEYVLTPMPVFKVHPIAAVELAATVTHILGSEQLNFPQRFAAGGVLFNETRRDVLAASVVKPAA